MSRYDGLIIPRSYSEYINKTDAATLQQALQLSGVLASEVTSNNNKAVKSSAVFTALGNYAKIVINKVSTFIDSNFSNSNISFTEDNGIVHIWGSIKNISARAAYASICTVPRPQSSQIISTFLYNKTGDNVKFQIITDNNNLGRIQNQSSLTENSIFKFDFTYAKYDNTSV